LGISWPFASFHHFHSCDECLTIDCICRSPIREQQRHRRLFKAHKCVRRPFTAKTNLHHILTLDVSISYCLTAIGGSTNFYVRQFRKIHVYQSPHPLFFVVRIRERVGRRGPRRSRIHLWHPNHRTSNGRKPTRIARTCRDDGPRTPAPPQLAPGHRRAPADRRASLCARQRHRLQ